LIKLDDFLKELEFHCPFPPAVEAEEVPLALKQKGPTEDD
jgi:hypothetical protein